MERLKQKVDESEYIDLDKAPNELIGKLVKFEFKEDKLKNQALFAEIVLKDSKKLIQKYTKTTYNHLYDAIEKLGGLKVVKENFCLWEQKRVGRTTLNRFFPVSVEKKEKK